MGYSRSACFLVVSLFVTFVNSSSIIAAEKDSQKSSANQPTTFLLFNTTANGTYQIQKNGQPLATRISTSFGVLRLDDPTNPGDVYIFLPDGVVLQPPSAPTGFVAAGSDSGCGDFAWNTNPGSDIVGYTIYLDTQSVAQGEVPNYGDSVEIAAPGTSAHLCGFPDGTYYVTLRARNVYGLRSPAAAEVAIAISNPGTTQPPLPPANVSASEVNPGCATVTWNANTELDLAGYTIYYGPQSVAQGQVPAYAESVTVGKVTSREICSLAAGTYYVALKAFNTSGDRSIYSQEASLAIVGPDATPPAVSITNLTAGAVISGSFTVSANATDNVGVAGVRLQIDGIDVGNEDTSSPYRMTFDSSTQGDGPHVVTAIARDAAGNTAASQGVAIIIDNDADPNHPALLLTGTGLAALRAKACRDANGQPIASCQPDLAWASFESLVSQYVTSGTYPGMQAWHFALVYKATKDPAYAARALALVQAEVANGMSAERAGDYDAVDDYLRNASIVYDWLHVFLDSSQKSSLVDYMNQLLTELWNPSGNPYHTWSGAEIDDPGSHRYYKFLMATGYTALATEGENPSAPVLSVAGVPYNTIDAFVLAKLDQEAFPNWLDTYGRGGGWHEGDVEGLGAKAAMSELFAILKAAGKPDYFAAAAFPREALLYELHSIEPGNQVKYPGGNLAPDPSLPVGDGDRRLMLLLAKGLEGTTEGGYAQSWLRTVYTAMSDPAMTAWDVLFDDAARSAVDYRTIPPAYQATGLGWTTSRSGWDANAVCVSFVSGDHARAAQHLDQNSFVVYRGGWQAGDAATFSSAGTDATTTVHNTILVDGVGQRTGTDTGSIVKFDGSADYGYTVGDASDAYYQGDKDAGGTKLLTTYQREVVHLNAGYVVVFDRVTPVNPSATVTYLLHTKNQPTISGDEVIAANATGKLFQRTLMPSNPSIRAVRESGGAGGLNSWRVEITPAASQANMNFLNVLYPADATTTAMPTVSTVEATTQNMVGVRIEDGGQDFVIMFSTDAVGAPPTGGVIYDVGWNGQASEHFLAGLLPNTQYAVNTTHRGDEWTVSVHRGKGYLTTRAGVLRFTVGNEFRVASVARE